MHFNDQCLKNLLQLHNSQQNTVAGTNIYIFIITTTIVVNKALVQIFADICVDTKGITELPLTLLCKWKHCSFNKYRCLGGIILYQNTHSSLMFVWTENNAARQHDWLKDIYVRMRESRCFPLNKNEDKKADISVSVTFTLLDRKQELLTAKHSPCESSGDM